MTLRVLIVDDEAGIREVLTRYLQARGYQVEAEGSAESALLRLVQDRFDAVLLDIGLPGLSGLRALPAITEEQRAAVFLMTGHADSELEKDAKLLGARGLFPKPLDLSAVEQALAQLPAK
jgi:DNA-binding NtrC family response regulator